MYKQKNPLREQVRQIVAESVYRYMVREQVKKVVLEAYHSQNKNIITEADDNSIEAKRKTVITLLGDKKYLHSQLAYDLWHPKDQNEKDRYRSEFSKKASGKPDADGVVREFTDDEVTKLYELLTTSN